jgi:hypothetical protein
MKHELFISYSRVDSAFALRLVGDLRRHGVEAWLDQLDIPPGASWDNEIEKALDHAKTVVVVLSGVSAKSENLKNEIGAALERGKQVVPIVLAKGAVPLMINRLQREDFTGDYESALVKLLHRLAGGSRTGSLRAVSAEDVQRAVSEATARLALQDGAKTDAPESSAARDKGLKTLLSEQFEMLDKNGDGILTQDELRGLRTDSAPDSLAPSSRPAERPAPASSSGRGFWLGGAGALLCVGLGLAFALYRRELSVPPAVATGATSLHAASAAGLPSNNKEPAAAPPVQKPAAAPAKEEPVAAAAKEEPAAAPAKEEPVAVAAKDEPAAVPVQAKPPAPSEAEIAEAAKSGRGMALVCGNTNFRGRCVKIPREPDMRKSASFGNNVASSVGLGNCRFVKICSEIDFGGQCQVLTADEPDLNNTVVRIKNLSSVECIGRVSKAAN